VRAGRASLSLLAFGFLFVQSAAAAPPSAEPAPAPNATPPNDGSAVVPPGAGSTSTTTVYQPFGLPAPGTDINAGLPSSSRPIRGDERDGFDLAPKAGGSIVLRGEPGATGVLGGESAAIAPLSVPELHVVAKGDTLWALSGRYYESPWQWPKLWSYNAQIKDPHWIYPGDQVLLRHPNNLGPASSMSSRSIAAPRGRLKRGLRTPTVGADTVFLRDQGFIGDPERDEWGEIAGAVEEQMLLAEGSNVYLLLEAGKRVEPGQELTIFRSVRQPEDVPGARTPPGQIVRVNGTVRIDRFDPKTRVARGVITESLDVIERGAKVGPVKRRFDVVGRRPNTKAVEARVLTSFYPHVYLAQNQIIFLDRGADDGLATGNTLFVLRRGDTWRKSLGTASKMVRDRMKMDSPEIIDIEQTPLSGDERKFPEEVVAELRVLRTEPKSAVALVMQSRRELVAGDRAVAQPGH
jgi:hypothetical protein